MLTIPSQQPCCIGYADADHNPPFARNISFCPSSESIPIPQVGPLQWGWIKPDGAHKSSGARSVSGMRPALTGAGWKKPSGLVQGWGAVHRLQLLHCCWIKVGGNVNADHEADRANGGKFNASFRLNSTLFYFHRNPGERQITSGSARYQNVSLPASPHSLRFGTTSIQIRVSETPPLF